MEELKNQNYIHNHLKKCQKSNKTKKKPIKIKYISSPVLVQANNAFEFRAIVQEFTGKNSNSDRFPNQDYTNKMSSTTEEASRIFINEAPEEDTNIFQNHEIMNTTTSTVMTSTILPQFDEGYLWREVSDNFCGFQFPCIFA